MWTTGDKLHPDDRRHVLNAYPYRMTVEAERRWPEAARTMRAGGYRMPARTDADWLRKTKFRTRTDGRLDRRARFCESQH